MAQDGTEAGSARDDGAASGALRVVGTREARGDGAASGALRVVGTREARDDGAASGALRVVGTRPVRHDGAASGALRVVGTRPVRHDGADKVTGRALYGADLQIAGMLHGKMLRSPHAHARILSIDTSKAEALPSVHAVVTAADLPHTPKGHLSNLSHWNKGLYSTKYLRDNILASDKALYQGHAVAAVAAANPHAAEQALELIDVRYEPLPPVLDCREALREGAPILHDDLRTSTLGDAPAGPTNLAERFRLESGDIDKGFEEAAAIVDREFHTGTVHQGYIEPHNTTALWNEDGRLTVWSSTQGSFFVRDYLQLILDLSDSDIRCVPMEIGGGFGGKFELYAEPTAALLSRKSGRPVKVVMSRDEEFVATGPAPGGYVRIRAGARGDGTITAIDADLVYEAGAYPGSPVAGGANALIACYDVPNVRVEGRDVVVNRPKAAAYRAPGYPNAAFALEQAIDELARKLSIDPLDMRLRNAAEEGTRRADGLVYPRIGLRETIEAMRDHPHYSEAAAGPNSGRGVAIGMMSHGGGRSACSISVNPDGTVGLVEGSTDIGGTRTSIAMQAAEALGIPAESVHPAVVDTDSIGFTHGTGGSRVTFATGLAAIRAAEDVRDQMLERAAALWDAAPDSLRYEHGVIRRQAEPELSITFQELAGRLGETGGPVVGAAAIDVARGSGHSYAAGNIVDVEVDPETGKVRILRYTVFQDAGRAVHPDYVEGQLQGGTIQGAGWGLNEAYEYDDQGRLTNGTFLDYRLMTTLDLPMISAVIVEAPSPAHPYGVRAVGEVNIIPPPAALANAIYDAVGVRMTELPMNPTAVMAAMGEAAPTPS